MKPADQEKTLVIKGYIFDIYLTTSIMIMLKKLKTIERRKRLIRCWQLLVTAGARPSGVDITCIIIQISYTVRIPIFRLVDLYHVALGYDETTSLTSLSWSNSRGVNSIHHCHYTMASADSKFDDFCLQCIQFE